MMWDKLDKYIEFCKSAKFTKNLEILQLIKDSGLQDYSEHMIERVVDSFESLIFFSKKISPDEKVKLIAMLEGL